MRPVILLRNVLLAINAILVDVLAAWLFPQFEDIFEKTTAILALPLLTGAVGVFTNRAWGLGASVASLTLQLLSFSLYLRNTSGTLHGGELFLIAWIGLAASCLVLVFLARATVK